VSPSIGLGEGFWYYRNAPSVERPVGGAVLLSNAGLPGDTRIFDWVGCPMEGDDWLAELAAETTQIHMAPVGDSVPFLTGPGAGFLDSGSDAVRYVSTVLPGGVAQVVVRFWEAQAGATYEEAVSSGGAHGTTASFTVITGGAGDPPSLPTPLIGLQSFSGSLPLITEVRGEQVVFPGARAGFSVSHRYVGPRTVSYQWQRATAENEWVDLVGATGATLEFVPVEAPDAGSYRVLVDVGCAAGTSDPISLEVLAAPPFSNPSVDPGSGEFRFTFEAESAYSYAIEVSIDLVNWSLLSTVHNPADPVEITDPEAPAHQQRFYRVRVLPDVIVPLRGGASDS
jgi:hypothetical protein